MKEEKSWDDYSPIGKIFYATGGVLALMLCAVLIVLVAGAGWNLAELLFD